MVWTCQRFWYLMFKQDIRGLDVVRVRSSGCKVVCSSDVESSLKEGIVSTVRVLVFAQEFCMVLHALPLFGSFASKVFIIYLPDCELSCFLLVVLLLMEKFCMTLLGSQNSYGMRYFGPCRGFTINPKPRTLNRINTGTSRFWPFWRSRGSFLKRGWA